METNYSLLKTLKQLDMVDYLSKSGHHPTKIHGNNYWFLSLLRQEKEASFKVDRKQNVWYDHGIGKGGNLVDFGILFHHCSVKEFLQKMSAHDFSFHQQMPIGLFKKEGPQNKIIVNHIQPIEHIALVNYLEERKMPLEIARLYCREVHYQLHDKHYYAIGFANDSGGFELRNKYFKGSSSPKDSRLIRNEGAEVLTAVEGFFSFLSYQAIFKEPQPKTDFLILNSLAFIQKNIERMQSYVQTKLMLDNDPAGDRATAKLLSISSTIKDERKFYFGHKDLNAFLIEQKLPLQHIIRKEGTTQKWNRHL